MLIVCTTFGKEVSGTSMYCECDRIRAITGMKGENQIWKVYRSYIANYTRKLFERKSSRDVIFFFRYVCDNVCVNWNKSSNNRYTLGKQ